MYAEENFIMISALQHYLFCPRQCALIHVEQLWSENLYTAEGRVMHERVHSPGKESRRRIKTEFDVPIRSAELGIVGRADIVEFHQQDDKQWLPFPVEYKRGRPKKNSSDTVQLCAQAMCLEEMIGIAVPTGALYYGKQKRRTEVAFDEKLRQETALIASKVHELLQSRVTPPPVYHKGCDSCSFLETCLPEITGKKNRVAKYMQSLDFT